MNITNWISLELRWIEHANLILSIQLLKLKPKKSDLSIYVNLISNFNFQTTKKKFADSSGVRNVGGGAGCSGGNQDEGGGESDGDCGGRTMERR